MEPIGSLATLMPDGTVQDSGFPAIFGAFIFIFVLVFVGAIVLAVVKFKATREMAIKKGATSTEATAVALSGNFGTVAAFVKPGDQAAAPHHVATVVDTSAAEDRIREVRHLQTQGLITAEQADARVDEILKGV